MVCKSPRVVGLLPNGRTSWLKKHGGDPNYLRYLGWSSKQFTRAFLTPVGGSALPRTALPWSQAVRGAPSHVSRGPCQDTNRGLLDAWDTTTGGRMQIKRGVCVFFFEGDLYIYIQYGYLWIFMVFRVVCLHQWWSRGTPSLPMLTLAMVASPQPWSPTSVDGGALGGFFHFEGELNGEASRLGEFRHLHIPRYDTPRKINMEPENTSLENENHLPNHRFQVLC